MEERIITANEASLLVKRAEEENRIKRWNFIMNKIEMECLLHIANVCIFDCGDLNEVEIQRLRDLGYTVELVEPLNDTNFYMVSWPEVAIKEEEDSEDFTPEDMRKAFEENDSNKFTQDDIDKAFT